MADRAFGIDSTIEVFAAAVLRAIAATFYALPFRVRRPHPCPLGDPLPATRVRGLTRPSTSTRQKRSPNDPNDTVGLATSSKGKPLIIQGFPRISKP